MPSPVFVREATASDTRLISTLLDEADRRHLHSDWYHPVELLGRKPFKTALVDGAVIGCLACPPDPPTIAWLRVFAVASGYPEDATWEALWPPAEDEMVSMGVKQAAAMLIGDWLRPLLLQSEFEPTNEVIFLEWFDRTAPEMTAGGENIRDMRLSDIPFVARVDQAAFNPLWQHSAGTLGEAYQQASYASVVEIEGDVVGYQITTASPLGAHLARLAVHPRAQGQGLGKRLVTDSICRMLRQGINRLTVNTQIDNHVSRLLYASLGFNETGLNYPVYERLLG